MPISHLYLNGLKTVRENQMLSQRDLAARAGVSHITVAKLETGKPVTFQIAQRLAKALDCTPAELTGRKVA